MSNYQTPATGSLVVPYKDGEDTPDYERAHTEIDASKDDSPEGFIVGRDDNIKVDELYYSDGSLGVTALYDDWYVSLDIPLRPNTRLRDLLRELTDAFDVASRESGYYVSNSDVAFVETVTPDAQGRITVGREYADQEIRVIVTDV